MRRERKMVQMVHSLFQVLMLVYLLLIQIQVRLLILEQQR